MYTINDLQELINLTISKESELLVSASPENLYLPVKYTLQMGGKRLRPVMVLLGYNLFKDDIKKALPVALGIEVFHNFTLLHDDIMDNADMRRHQPTVHKKFNENMAILSGDAMSFLAIRYLAKNDLEQMTPLIRHFSDTAIQVCEGQQFDMDFESRLDVSESEYLNMIRLKTAVLLGCSLKSGALAANASESISNGLFELGVNLGMAFQLQDDLLDTFGDEKVFGKKIGGDIVANKKTYLVVKALEIANDEQKIQLRSLLSGSDIDPAKKISQVKHIFSEVNIESIIEQRIEDYIEKSNTILVDLPVEESKKSELLLLMKKMVKRNH